MRLIDKDELMKKIGIKDHCVDTDCDADECEATCSVCFAIREAPTIDPVRGPKHGRWISDNYTRVCSECGAHYWLRFAEQWNYCPNCGAKMDMNGGKK